MKKKNCSKGINCKNTCISRTKDCLLTRNSPKVSIAASKLKAGPDLKDWGKIKSIAWGRMQLFTTGHEKLAKKADLTLLSKATDSHINTLSSIFPKLKFATTDKGLFNYLAKFKDPVNELILGEDNKPLGDQILKYKLAKKVTYIPRPPGSVSSTEARRLFREGKTPEEMIKLGFFSNIEQAAYGQKIALDLT